MLNDLWATMLIKFPYTWEKVSGNDPVNPVTNELTPVALDWVAQLKGLKKSEITAGIEALATRDEKRFPPNAMEFRELCTGSDHESVLEAVLCRLQEGNNYQWTDQLAFNFWSRYSFDLLNAQKYEVPRLIKQNLNLIDKSSMFPLPDYSVKAIEKPATKDEQEQKQIKKRFFATMTVVLMQFEKVYPKKFETLMKTGRGWEIVQDYLSKGFELPERVGREGKKADEFDSMFGKINKVFRDSMVSYLRKVEVLT